MDELLEQFLIEGKELTQQASDDLMALEREPNSAARIDSAFRAIHTLKGSAALFEFAPMTEALHAAEDLIGALRAKRLRADRPIVTTLLDCVVSTEAWIEHVERVERLPDDAAMRGLSLRRALLAHLALEDRPSATPPSDLDWVKSLLAREQHAVSLARSAQRMMNAIRYVPNADCFFQGDDPFAIMRLVPELLAVRVCEREPWATERFDPYQCNIVIEALSAAPLDELQRVFRFVSDQITVVDADLHGGAPAENSLTETPTGSGSRSLRVDTSKIDALADVAGELIVAKNALAHLVARTKDLDPALARAMAANHAEFDRLVGTMRRAVTRLRTVPLAGTFRRFPRLVRDIADKLGKDVAFVIEGQEVEADKTIVDGLYEPLLHVIRNALDHGIETAEKRQAVGKPPTGRVTLRARREIERIVVTVSDDGGGIDTVALRKAAETQGVAAEAASDAQHDTATAALVFAPGVSTSESVTDISGRGVGMDVVRTAIELLGGRVDLSSEAGAGTTIVMSLPQSVLVTSVMTVRVGGELYGIPLDVVAETVRVALDRIKPIRSGEAFVLRDRTIPLVRLSSALSAPIRERTGADIKALVVSSVNQRVALEVDAFVERTDVLMRPMTGLLSGMPGILGTAVLGDGHVLLILDVAEMIA